MMKEEVFIQLAFALLAVVQHLWNESLGKSQSLFEMSCPILCWFKQSNYQRSQQSLQMIHGGRSKAPQRSS
jgi:hypothetical protein